MRLTEINLRLAELDKIVSDSQDIEEVRKAIEERKTLEAEKAQILAQMAEDEKRSLDNEIEKRAAKAAILSGNPSLGTPIEAKSAAKQSAAEYRNSAEYINAFAEYKKTGDDTEVRALLTTNTGDGTIVVPEVVFDEIKTAWDSNEIMSLVTNKLEVAGNLDQQFEISGDDAIHHDEGSGAVAEENLTIGNVKIIPGEIIKWITLSKAVMSMRGEAFLRYIYREITHKIVAAEAADLIAKIVALPANASSSSPNAKKVKLGAAVGTVVEAIGNLSDEATNPVVVINKLSYSAMKKAAYNNNYGVDPFENLTVKFNSNLPAFSAANENDVWMIVGDFGYGVMANYPNGQTVEMAIDTLSLRTEGKIKVIGDQYMGAEVVACKAFTLVTKPASV